MCRNSVHANWDGWKLEVVDMDGMRMDKVLATPLPAGLAPVPTVEKLGEL